jgi:hypothetical protein
MESSLARGIPRWRVEGTLDGVGQWFRSSRPHGKRRHDRHNTYEFEVTIVDEGDNGRGTRVIVGQHLSGQSLREAYEREEVGRRGQLAKGITQ